MKPLRLLAFLEANEVTGPAKNLLQFARLATQAGNPVETTIATFRRPGDPEVFLQVAARSGVSVESIAERGRFDRAVLADMVALCRRLQPDVVQTHAVKSHFLARMAGLPALAPWVAFHHGYTWPDLRARLYNQLDRWSLPRARHLITVSIPFRSELEGMGVRESKTTIIHNAIDPQWGQLSRSSAPALREKLGIPLGRQIILIVGRLSREKDHMTLLAAVAGLRRNTPPLSPHVLIVGNGPERNRLESSVQALDLSGYVTFAGQVPSAEPYYGLADVAVLSSLSEGSPNALLEAMAARVPVVATAVGGIPEIVTHQKSALLVPAADHSQLAQALQQVLTDPLAAGALVEEASRTIQQKHAPAVRVEQLCGLYRNIVAGYSAEG